MCACLRMPARLRAQGHARACWACMQHTRRAAARTADSSCQVLSPREPAACPAAPSMPSTHLHCLQHAQLEVWLAANVLNLALQLHQRPLLHPAAVAAHRDEHRGVPATWRCRVPGVCCRLCGSNLCGGPAARRAPVHPLCPRHCLLPPCTCCPHWCCCCCWPPAAPRAPRRRRRPLACCPGCCGAATRRPSTRLAPTSCPSKARPSRAFQGWWVPGHAPLPPRPLCATHRALRHVIMRSFQARCALTLGAHSTIAANRAGTRA